MQYLVQNLIFIRITELNVVAETVQYEEKINQYKFKKSYVELWRTHNKCK